MLDASAMSNEALLAIFAAVQVLSVALSKVIDYFVDRGRTDPIEAKLDALTKSAEQWAPRRAEDSRMISDMYTMHKVTDDEGRPIWYFPKKMLDMADEHLEMLREISLAQKETALEMKSIVNQLINMKSAR